MLGVFDKYRRTNGIIDLDSIKTLKETNRKTYGSRKKQWFDYRGIHLLFKEEKLPYESLKEILNEQIALAYGLKNVNYDIATYQGALGTISFDFINEKEFIPFLFLLQKKPCISNDLVTISEILSNLNVREKKIEEITHLLFKNYLLDLFTMQRDRNVMNQGFLYDNNEYNLAPRYDSAGSFLTITARDKMERFYHQFERDMLIKYKGYRSKFTLCPGTVKMNAIDVLLDVKYQKIECQNIYLVETLKNLDTELNQIYTINLKEIFNELEFYNLKLENYFKRFIEYAFEMKKNEYEEKEKNYTRIKIK